MNLEQRIFGRKIRKANKQKWEKLAFSKTSEKTAAFVEWLIGGKILTINKRFNIRTVFR